ncbi:hypothetical protein EDC04DRAFT_2762030 [Pisolithus marmoratus]|nr:hypothetical protein EDC04DRAFT_2762030 [Pisolithus marmoratus]
MLFDGFPLDLLCLVSVYGVSCASCLLLWPEFYKQYLHTICIRKYLHLCCLFSLKTGCNSSDNEYATLPQYLSRSALYDAGF